MHHSPKQRETLNQILKKCFRQFKNDPERQSEIDPPLLRQNPRSSPSGFSAGLHDAVTVLLMPY